MAKVNRSRRRSRRRVKRRSIKRSVNKRSQRRMSRRMSRRSRRDSKRMSRKMSRRSNRRRVKRSRRNSKRVVRGGQPSLPCLPCWSNQGDKAADVARKELVATMRGKGIPLNFTDDETGEKYIDKSGIKFETILAEWQDKVKKDELERKWLAKALAARERNTGQNTTMADVVMDERHARETEEAKRGNIRSQVIKAEMRGEAETWHQGYQASQQRDKKAAQNRAAAVKGQEGLESQDPDYSYDELNSELASAIAARVRRAGKLGV